MFKNRKKKKQTHKGIYIIEDMVTDNNGIPIVSDDQTYRPQHHEAPKKSQPLQRKTKTSNFSSHFSGGSIEHIPPKKKKNRWSFFRVLLFLVFISGFVYSVGVLVDWSIDAMTAKNEYNDTLSMLKHKNDSNVSKNIGDILDISNVSAGFPLDDITNIADIQDNLKTIAALNDDFYCWVQMTNTNIDYPVVKANDNAVYLNRTYGGRDGVKSGTIFADYRLSNNVSKTKNLVLYGHNMSNGTMFGMIPQLFKNDQRSWELFDSSIIRIYTLDSVYIYQPFSIYATTQYDNYVKQDFSKDSDWVSFLQSIYDKGLYNWKKDMRDYIKADTKIITFSTCTNYSAIHTQQRFVLHAVLLDVIKFK